MEVPGLRRVQPMIRRRGRRMGKTARASLCAAALLASVGSVAGVTQTSAQVLTAVGDPEQGQRIAETKCAICHGADGNSVDTKYPKLSAQNPAYLYEQLWAFKRAARRSSVMSGIVATLSNTEMAAAAKFYSQQPRKPDTVKDQRLAAIGARIFFSGMPACAMCHGSTRQRGMPMMRGMRMMGRGMMEMGGFANVPRLNGQHAAYLVDQLYRFAAGERQGTVMNRIAASLSERDMKAVAEYLSGLR